MINLTIGGTTKRSNNGQHTVEIDFDALPDASRDFVIRYGLKQYLADGAAGAGSNAELVAGVEERVRKLREADFQRTRGEGSAKPDTEERIAMKLAKELIRVKAKAAGVTLPKEKVEAAAEAFLAKDTDEAKAIKTEAKRQIAAKAKLTADDATADAFLAELGLTD